MKILIVDNYDSFTYNLVQLLDGKKNELIIKRNDEITITEVRKIKPEKILISPGPGRPENAGISLKLINAFGKKIPTLGVCLGLQVIGIAFNAKVANSKELIHGKTSEIIHDGKTIFNGLPETFVAMRYHSLSVLPNSIPNELEVSAKTSDGTIMGIRHINYPIEGIQFHPESVLTNVGKQIISNWMML